MLQCEQRTMRYDEFIPWYKYAPILSGPHGSEEPWEILRIDYEYRQSAPKPWPMARQIGKTISSVTDYYLQIIYERTKFEATDDRDSVYGTFGMLQSDVKRSHAQSTHK